MSAAPPCALEVEFNSKLQIAREKVSCTGNDSEIRTTESGTRSDEIRCIENVECFRAELSAQLIPDNIETLEKRDILRKVTGCRQKVSR